MVGWQQIFAHSNVLRISSINDSLIIFLLILIVRSESKIFTYLISPLVNDWHVDVVDKHSHFLAGWWTVRCTHSFVHVTLNSALLNTRQQMKRTITDKRVLRVYSNSKEQSRLNVQQYLSAHSLPANEQVKSKQSSNAFRTSID